MPDRPRPAARRSNGSRGCVRSRCRRRSRPRRARPAGRSRWCSCRTWRASARPTGTRRSRRLPGPDRRRPEPATPRARDARGRGVLRCACCSTAASAPPVLEAERGPRRRWRCPESALEPGQGSMPSAAPSRSSETLDAGVLGCGLHGHGRGRARARRRDPGRGTSARVSAARARHSQGPPPGRAPCDLRGQLQAIEPLFPRLSRASAA